MDALDLARWQFGITTVYHFFFVPITIGLSLLVAIMQTQWMRTRNPQWLRLTKFFGKLFTINFALGLVTGIVQEFQFGMNWSNYSRFVGDIFGAPLAMEGLIAFFFEATCIDPWFLDQVLQIWETAVALRDSYNMSPELLFKAKRMGLSDAQIAALRNTSDEVVRGVRWALGVNPVFKTVDTCAAEFASPTAYMYSSYAMPFDGKAADEANPSCLL